MKRLKDYYKILEIISEATQQDIKQSYRKLAHQYHPDKNQDNSFADAHFKEIQEAYTILSNPNKRRKYDEVRWLSGMGKRMRNEQHITSQWVLDECAILSSHMLVLDTYRMSHHALYDYVMLILSDQHMAVLHDHSENNEQVVSELLKATKRLRAKYMEPFAGRLSELAGNNARLISIINNQVRESKKHENRDKYLPWWVAIITLLLCLLMFFYGMK